MDSAPEMAIEIVGLSKRFGEKTAVDGIDLSVTAGSFLGFLGPNGAGKSTTIKILTGLLLPSTGTARILGHDVVDDAVAAKRLMGVVSEDGAVFERLTGAEYLELVGRMYGMDRGTIGRRSGELLAMLELATESKTLVIDYSHGMRKKLCLAAALIHDPKVLLLDEPFEGIDAVAARLIKEILAQLRDAGVTIFLTSHILEIVEKLCTEIAVIHRGCIVARGKTNELRSSAGAASSLEDFFLDLVGENAGSGRRLSWLG